MLQFPVYERLREELRGTSLEAVSTFVAGAGAGAAATVATYPLDVIRSQFAAQGVPRVGVPEQRGGDRQGMVVAGLGLLWVVREGEGGKGLTHCTWMLGQAHETMLSFVRHTLATQGVRGLFAVSR
jgi:hypothetical protein